MIVDARNHLASHLETEVCVVGAGPAGMVTALTLARAGRHVILVEAGGLDGPEDSAQFYEGEVAGRSYPLAGSRLRWFGGTSNHWGGWCRPLDQVDFLQHPDHALPSWPFTRDVLDDWYAVAADWCEIPATEYDPDRTGLHDTDAILDLPLETGFANHLFRFSPPTRFGTRYRAEIEHSTNLQTWVNLAACELQRSGDRTTRLLARTIDGRSTTIDASCHVLAMGGLENARFLLNQNPVPGNHADLVGRCFMDHFGFSPGFMLAPGGVRYTRFDHHGLPVMPVIAPTAEALLAGGIQNACITLSPAPDNPHVPAAYLSENPVLRQGVQPTSFRNFRIQMINPPRPNRDSRVTLSDERDAMGLRKLRLEWRLTDEDFTAALTLIERFARVMGSSGQGRLQWTRRELPPPDHVPGVGLHHTGTTRMSAQPEAGVTDPHGRVWGTTNLFIAGSSLFPAIGYSNPTLTIVALAARLAAEVDRQLS